jgi:hypothetical protein
MNDQVLSEAATAEIASRSRTELYPWLSKTLDRLKWAISFPAMLATFIIGRVFIEARSFSVDPDLWWHIRVGQDILATHRWPIADTFSYTVHGTPWLAYEWLGDVAIATAAKFGLVGLEVFLFGLGSIIMVAVYCFASLRSGNCKASFVAALLLSWFSVANFNLRPQMFGFLFLVVTLILLEKFRRGADKALWLLPPLFLIWINTHGSWIIGIGVVIWTLISGLLEFRLGTVEAARWTQKQRLQLEMALAGALAMIPLTPYGTQLAAYPFTVASSLPLNVAAVSEWQPMPFATGGGKVFLFTLIGAFVLQSLFKFTFRLQEWTLALGGAAMATLHVRFVLLFVPFFAPVLALLLARWTPAYDRQKDKYAINAVLMAGAIIAMIRYFPNQQALKLDVAKQFPVHAVEYMRSHGVTGPVFNSYGFGGYLVGYLPGQKVFIDGRGDLYEVAGAFNEYLQVVELKPPAFPILKAHGIRTCLLDRAEPLAVVLENNREWKKVYSDETSALFLRNVTE